MGKEPSFLRTRKAPHSTARKQVTILLEIELLVSHPIEPYCGLPPTSQLVLQVYSEAQCFISQSESFTRATSALTHASGHAVPKPPALLPTARLAI